MLRLILGTSWRANRDRVLQQMNDAKGDLVLLAPEQVSHDYERRLCRSLGPAASRRAEVLSFTRLASRIFALTGGGARPSLDGGGRLLAMASAVRELAPRLKAYAPVGTRPEFLSALVTAVDEFKSCCITPKALKEAKDQTEGVLAQKLEELSLLLEAYNAACGRHGQDPRDRMTKLLEQLEDTDFAANHSFFVDGFSDFTAQEREILALLLQQSPCVTVSLVCDGPKTATVGMELAGETAQELMQQATRMHIPYEVELLPDAEADSPLGRMRRGFLSGDCSPNPALQGIAHAVRLSSVWAECSYAAGCIRELASKGVRYRDMSLVCAREGDIPVLRQVLHQYHIPVYFAGNEDILHKSVIYTVMTALEAVTEGLDRENVLRYLKSVLSPLSPSECDELENYALMWRIRGRQWAEPFTRHPQGLKNEKTEEDVQTLARLEENRIRGVGPLLDLSGAMSSAKTALDMLRALYAFLEQVQLSDRLEALTLHFEQRGDSRSAREQEQLWDILVGAMEQMAAVLGDSAETPDTFVRFFRLLLSQYSVGTIPQTLDSVTAGGVAAMRRQQAKHVFLLGASEGSLPAGSRGGMVLTEQERRSLMDLGVPLRQDLYRQLQQELAGILAVAGSATEGFTMTVSGGEAAYAFRRLCRMLDIDPQEELHQDPALFTPDAWALSSQYIRAGKDAPESVQAVQQDLQGHAQYALGSLTPETVRALYGRKLRLSASKVDKLASCRFAYFMNYGLGLKPRKEADIDPAEFGTFVHDVLENSVLRVKELGGFRQVSLEQTRAIAMEQAERYRQEHFKGLLGSERGDYLFRRNLEELDVVVRELWKELSQSLFQPYGCEVKFGGKDAKMPEVEIKGGAIPAILTGSVDRLDTYEKDGKTYIRVVDYKTGSKSFDFTDVLNGIGLQMLIYLFALEDKGEAYLQARPDAAGVLYFPARSRIISAKDKEDMKKDALKARMKDTRRKGLLLDDDAIRLAMDPNQDSEILPEAQKFAATPMQFAQLKTYVNKTLNELVGRIAGGDVRPDPCWRGQEKACDFCDYSACCHLSMWGKPRNYKEIKPQEFWDEVQKGVKGNG